MNNERPTTMSIDTIIATDVSPEITICPSKSLMLGTFTTDVKFTTLNKIANALGVEIKTLVEFTF